MTKKKWRWAVILSAFIVVTSLGSLLYNIVTNGNNIVTASVSYFQAYTVNTNMLWGVCCIPIFIFLLKNKDGSKDLPRWLRNFQLVCTVGVVLTFLMVVGFLAPMMAFSGAPWYFMFAKDMVFFHVLNPLVAVAMWFVLMPPYVLKKGASFLGMTTLFVYGPIYTYEVLISEKWPDFYGLTFGGQMQMVPFSVIGMFLITFLISFFFVRRQKKHSIQKG